MGREGEKRMSITTPKAEVAARARSTAAAVRGTEQPLTLAELQETLRRHRSSRICVSGSGRAEAPAADCVAIDLSRLRGIIEINEKARTATFLAGTTIDEASVELEAHGYSMVGAPADAAATIGGAVSVGARGYSPKEANFSGSIVELGLLTVEGDYLTVSRRKNAQYWQAVKLGLGALGVITHVTVRLRTYQALRSQRFSRSLDEMLDELNEASAKVDFYRAEWKPTSGKARVEVGWLEPASPAAVPARAFPLPAGDEESSTGGFRAAVKQGIARVLPKVAPIVDRVSSVLDRGDAAGLRDGRDVAGRTEFRSVMEYQFPQERVADAIGDLSELARVSRNFGGARARLSLLGGDDAFVSAAYGGPVVTLALEAQGSRAEAAFREAEELFIRHGGLPNWGTWNTFTGAEAADVMPRYSDFKHAVHDLDPNGRLVSSTTAYLRLH